MSIDYDSVMDKNLTLEEFTEKLEDLLRKNRIGIVERRKIIRQKQQEFRELVRIRDIRKREDEK
ncbi:MAG: hypothetical protein JW891_18490 [Candidatus Lokiarchaeota archaeon]|nr:hypothetical protein [Candidatus Lokiarchaeota archaeon]